MKKRYDKKAVLEDLISRGKKKGSIKISQIEKVVALPSQIEEVFELCAEEGIEIIDDSQTDNVNDNEITNEELGIVSVGISNSIDSVTAHLNDIAKEKLLTKEEEQELGRIIKEGSKAEAKKALDKLVEANLKLVIPIAKRYAKKTSIELFGDYIQCGNMGVMEAARRFDYKKDCRFSTYATWWIKQHISRCYMNNYRSIRIPVPKIEQINNLNNTYANLLMEYGREPTDEEIAKRMEIKVSLVRELKVYSLDAVSLNKKINEVDEGEEILFFVPDEGQDKYAKDIVDKILVKKILKAAEEYLTDNEYKVIILRFGLADGIEYTYESISKRLGVTKERVRQIEAQAIRKMKSNNKKLKTDDW